MRIVRPWVAVTLLPVALAVSACSDSPRPYGDRTTAPPSATVAPDKDARPGAPTMAPPGVPRDAQERKSDDSSPTAPAK